MARSPSASLFSNNLFRQVGRFSIKVHLPKILSSLPGDIGLDIRNQVAGLL